MPTTKAETTIRTQVIQPFLADCPAEQNVPIITPFSQLGKPPETISPFEQYGGLAFAVVLSGFVIILLVPFAPLIIVLTVARRIWSYFACSSYHTHPSKLKIAVIGGGWSGVQIISRLQELGVTNITGFEKNDDLGGTWHPTLRYHSVQIHGAMWLTSFDKYPYSPNNKDVSDGKVLGAEALAYVKRFADHTGVGPCYQFNNSVVSVKYDSSRRNATLVTEDARGNRSEKGPYDFVVYASQASEPNLPSIPGQELFKGKILHSLWFKTTQFEEIIKSKAKVVIIGGSKTACDMVLCFQRAGYEAFNWVFRKPYIYWKYEFMFHDSSPINALRGMTTLVAITISLFSSKLMGLIMWCSGLGVTDGKRHMDWNKFHWGILCPKQRRDLAMIPQQKRYQSGIKCLHSNSIELQNGQKIQADYILLGTGCHSGLEKLEFEKDGATYSLNAEKQLLHHFLVPTFPVFGNSTALWTTFGPKRAVNSADMIIYHLCVRKSLTEQQMVTMASWQLGDCSANVDPLFQKENTVKAFVIRHINLMLSGLVDVFDFLWHAVELFCLARQTTLRFDILPTNACNAGTDKYDTKKVN